MEEFVTCLPKNENRLCFFFLLHIIQCANLVIHPLKPVFGARWVLIHIVAYSDCDGEEKAADFYFLKFLTQREQGMIAKRLKYGACVNHAS